MLLTISNLSEHNFQKNFIDWKPIFAKKSTDGKEFKQKEFGSKENEQ